MAKAYALAKAESALSSGSASPALLTPPPSGRRPVFSTSDSRHLQAMPYQFNSYDPPRNAMQQIGSGIRAPLHATIPAYNHYPAYYMPQPYHPRAYGSAYPYGMTQAPPDVIRSPRSRFARPYDSGYRPSPNHFYDNDFNTSSPVVQPNFEKLQLGITPREDVRTNTAAQMQAKRSEEITARYAIIEKIIDNLMESNLDDDQLLAASAAVLKNEPQRYSDKIEVSAGDTNWATLDRNESLGRETYDDHDSLSRDCPELWDNKPQNVDSSTADDGWGENHDYDASDWASAPVQVALNAHWNSEDDEKVAITEESPQRMTEWCGTGLNEVPPASEEPAGPNEDFANDIGNSEKPTTQITGKFNDPCLVQVYLPVSDWDPPPNGASLWLPRSTLVQLLAHTNFDVMQPFYLTGTKQFRLEAVKEIFTLLELSSTKQRAICRCLPTNLFPDMYSMAVSFELNDLAELLLQSMLPDWTSLQELTAVAESIDAHGRADEWFMEVFKNRVQNAIRMLNDSWSTRSAGLAKMKEARAVLTGVSTPSVKNTIYEALLDSVCGDTRDSSPWHNHHDAAAPRDKVDTIIDECCESESKLTDDSVFSPEVPDCSSTGCSCQECLDDAPPRPPTPAAWGITADNAVTGNNQWDW